VGSSDAAHRGQQTWPAKMGHLARHPGYTIIAPLSKLHEKTANENKMPITPL
jgi:hypothetical protein